MINVQDLSYSYPHSSRRLIANCSFSARSGEVVAILGSNGSGKTTLIKILLGLLPAACGKVSQARSCAYVPQKTHVPFDYSVLEVVVMGASSQNGFFAVPKKQDKIRARAELARVGLLERADASFAQLSGGQQQMVLIARALVSQPEILIMDEPTSALDYRNQNRVLQSITETAGSGKTVIFTSHCPTQALRVADRVLLIGSTDCTFGNADEILSESNLSQLYQTPIGRYQTTDGEVISPKFSSI